MLKMVPFLSICFCHPQRYKINGPQASQKILALQSHFPKHTHFMVLFGSTPRQFL